MFFVFCFMLVFGDVSFQNEDRCQQRNQKGGKSLGLDQKETDTLHNHHDHDGLRLEQEHTQRVNDQPTCPEGKA